MPKTSLIVITGFPGTGKTTLGKKMAEEFSLPLIAKDDIKEFLFDILGYKDIEWSEKISGLAYDILYQILEFNLKSGKSTIIESNFSPRFVNRQLLDLKKKYNFNPIQIRCITEGKILLKRFEKRANSDNRHPGHVDKILVKKLKPFLLKGKIEALDIGGKTFDFDTSDFNKIDYSKLFKSVKETIEFKALTGRS